MKAIIIFSTYLISIYSIKIENHKETRCSDFKTGKFELVNKKTNRKYIIQRSKNNQKEEVFDLTTGKKIIEDKFYKILWKNDCQYTLHLNLTKGEHDETDQYINSHGGYNCTIKKINDKCANVETEFQGDVLTSEMCKIQWFSKLIDGNGRQI